MEKYSAHGRVLRSVLALASAAFLIHSASGEESPYATGGEVTILRYGNAKTSYVHVFTNADEAATFASTGKRDLKVRYLVVGAGGSGGSYNSGNEGGGGGGGGGVCERDGVSFVSGSTWQVIVGKGSGGSAVAGASSISNGTVEVETVPGGGNGASGSSTAATSGASGGGGKRTAGTSGAVGTYISSILGVSPEGAPFKGGNNSSSRSGGGGGGAGSAGTGSAAAGTKAPTVRGGEGLVSDITGEELVYGSGGGGGCGKNTTPSFYQGGLGGTRAGDGGYFDLVDWTNVTYAATDAEPNSGGGGGGAAGYGADTRRGRGADGIVVIRYDIYDSPCEGGDIVTKKVDGPITTWVHQFTDTTKAAEFWNCAGRDLSVRYLVVGAGGAGGKYMPPGARYGGGGGGGGGGVCEKGGVPFPGGSTWQIFIGKGGVASVSNTMARSCGGVSAISNGVADVETVLGGGGGASDKKGVNGYKGQDGASGGGGNCGWQNAAGRGLGTYTNSLFGVAYGPFNGGSVNTDGGGAGGGGASANGSSNSNSAKGGEGLASDITGEWLVYGSGGGGGCGGVNANLGNWKNHGGAGGTRAGDGADFEVSEDKATTNIIAATMPAANSGGGGAGGCRYTATYAPTPGADGIVVISYKTYYDGACPCAGGDAVTRTLVRGTRYTYRHFFTDARMADLFVNTTGRKLKLRYLVVGGGGSGGNANGVANASANSGGGGGGGGVREVKDVPFGADGEWTVRVGAGAKKVVSTSDPGTVAGASSISNGTDEVALVPGGGNGGRGSTAEKSAVPATAGAAGGGCAGPGADAHVPGSGTYQSSIFGVVPAGAPFSGGEYGVNTDGTGSYLGSGGGGAGETGGASVYKTNGGNGGEGLVSDITGEALVYGSGGGGGAQCTSARRGVGGKGGTRAGDGGTFVETTEGDVFYPATAPVANSGGGGGGGGTGTDDDAAADYSVATDGADGIVVISYDYDATPPGFLMLFK